MTCTCDVWARAPPARPLAQRACSLLSSGLGTGRGRPEGRVPTQLDTGAGLRAGASGALLDEGQNHGCAGQGSPARAGVGGTWSDANTFLSPPGCSSDAPQPPSLPSPGHTAQQCSQTPWAALPPDPLSFPLSTEKVGGSLCPHGQVFFKQYIHFRKKL